MSTADVRNGNLSIGFDLSQGIAIDSIRDAAIGREYLNSTSMLFEYAVNGTVKESNTSLSVLTTVVASDGSSLSVVAFDGQLTFELQVDLPPDGIAAVLRLSVTTVSESLLFVRVVMPKIFGLVTPQNATTMMGAVPQEAGSVVPMTEEVTLGMPFNPGLARDVGLPTARNNMELASLYDNVDGGGVFFCDVDGDLNNGIPPLQFNLSAQAVVAFWIGNVTKGVVAQLSGLAIGVHSTGDWHRAVDFYTSMHRPRWSFPSTPAWFRDTPAIYAPTPLTAGAIYLDQPWQPLADGTVWNTWENNNGPWKDGGGDKNINGFPSQISTAGFAPAGALLQAVMQNANQLDVFAVDSNGAIGVTWESDNGLWRSGRHNMVPAAITPPGYALPGSALACGQQGDDQLDVFFVPGDGAIWVTWERGDNPWTDGINGRPLPVSLTGPNLFPPGANLAVAKTDTWLNVFAVDVFGAIRTIFVDGYGGWQQEAITGPNQFSPGGSLAVTTQDADQIALFAIDTYGTIVKVSKDKDLGWQMPMMASPTGFAPLKAFLATAPQNTHQIDVFVVRDDGAIWVTWGYGNQWTDGLLGNSPQPITPPNLTSPGAPLAAAKQGDNQLNVFVAGNFDAIWVTWEAGDGAWTDGANGRPGPVLVTPWGYAPRGGGVAAIARSKDHVDAFAVGAGRIQSFLQLPKLLGEAQCLGTNIVYLTDYWEGTDQGNDPWWWNKGDFQPRADLGGRDAFIEGINAIQRAGGRVILYLEPFVTYRLSNIAQNAGADWVGLDDSNVALEEYTRGYSMVAPLDQWRRYVAQTAVRLVGEYGADGVFLDSYAWQMNRPMRCKAGGSYSALDYTRGVLDLTQAVRDAIQDPRVKPDAVVLGETTAGPIAQKWDGGLSADFGFANLWGKDSQIERLIASPVRYGIPEVRIFSNGIDLNGLQQIYAAGHGLALSSLWPGTFMFQFSAYIRCLVELRSTYRDALIHGIQSYQPQSDNPYVVAYLFEGTRHRILTIVNISGTDQTASIKLAAPDQGWAWKDLLNGDGFAATDQTLHGVRLPFGEGALRVLLHHRLPHIQNLM